VGSAGLIGVTQAMTREEITEGDADIGVVAFGPNDGRNLLHDCLGCGHDGPFSGVGAVIEGVRDETGSWRDEPAARQRSRAKLCAVR